MQTEPPAETNPPEKIDLQELVIYSGEYTANTYGYEVCIGLRDGYYPADDHLIYTMEDGYKAVRASVDCTTRMLLARPGAQIVTEIDGVLCRARIDIAIQYLGDGISHLGILRIKRCAIGRKNTTKCCGFVVVQTPAYGGVFS